MDTEKRKRLEAAGWSVNDAADFLKLTPEEAALVEMRLALSRTLRARRSAAGAYPDGASETVRLEPIACREA